MKVLIMGGGVIGVTTAYYLARDGHEVTILDRQPQPASETSFANAGLVAPGHAFAWASPKAPKVLLKSLFKDDQALRLRLSADPRMWMWFALFLRQCTDERARTSPAPHRWQRLSMRLERSTPIGSASSLPMRMNSTGACGSTFKQTASKCL